MSSAVLAFGWLALLGTITEAQKTQTDTSEYGIFQSQEAYYQFMGGVKSNPETRGMVDVINDIVLQRPMGSTSKQYGSSGSTLGLLSDPKVRQELEVMDDQYEQLQQANQEIQQRAAAQLQALDLTDNDNLISQIRKIRDQADRELNAVLLPHQMKRLQQLQSQSRLRGRSFVELITSEPLKAELEITDEQSQELRDAEREIEAELQKEIAALQEKARRKLLSRLKKSQREQVESIFGTTFNFAEESNKAGQKSADK